MLARALKMAFWVTYDHLGKLLIASVVWALCVGIPGLFAVAALLMPEPSSTLLIGVPALLIALGIAMPISSTSMACLIKELIETRDGSLSTFFSGFYRYGLRAAGLGIAYSTALVCLGVSVIFYSAKLKDSIPWLGYGMSAVALWGFIFLFLTMPLAPFALIHKKTSMPGAIKLAALLVLDNPLTTIGLMLQLIAWTALSVAIPPVFIFLYGGVVAASSGSVYEILARKYALQDTWRAQGGKDTHHLRELTAKAIEQEDEEDDYLNRGFRDFLFPWKG